MKRITSKNRTSKRIASILIAICMVITGVGTGFADRVMTGEATEASAASYPALKKITYKATGNQRDDIIGFAKTQLGYQEGKNNNTYFGNWYGANYNPWCAMFVCWSARKAGVDKSIIPASATADRSWAKKKGVYKKSKYWGGNYTPKKGDLIYFSWSVRDWADHIGMVTGTGKSGGTTYVYTIEGNKHDKVTEGSYPLNNRYILGYASPKYTTGKATDTPTAAEGSTYTLKYRSELTTENNDEDDAIIPPVTGTFGKNLTLSGEKFQKSGYTYAKWKIYRTNKKGTKIYLCRDTATGTTEKWYAKSKIPEDYTRIYVKCGEAMKLSTKFSGDVFATPVWKERPFKVTYDANGGTNPPQAQEKKHGDSVTLTTEQPVRSGYKFKGWSTDKKAAEPQYSGGEVYQEDQDMTLFAVWQVEKYKAKVTGKCSARSGPGKEYKEKYSIKAGTKVKIIQISGNWGQMEDKNWIPLKYTQRLNATDYQLNYEDGLSSTKTDSAVIPPVIVSYGEPLTASVSIFPRTGYHYDNWKIYYPRNGEAMYLCRDKKTGKQKWIRHDKIKGSGCAVRKIAPGEQVTIKTSVGDQIFLTPIWEKNVYTVTYNANGGKKAPKAQKVEHGKKLTLRKGKPTRKGYQFLGWAAASNASKAAYSPGKKYTTDKSLTLYAVWKADGEKYITTDEVNKRKGPGLNYRILAVIPKGKTVTIVKKKGSWGKLKSGGWIHLSLAKKVKVNRTASADTQATEPPTGDSIGEGFDFFGRVIARDGVNARFGPDLKYDAADFFAFGDEMVISEVENGWGRLTGEQSDQWIPLENVRITDGYQVEVTSEDVQQKSGPGSEYEDRGDLKPGTYAIVRISGDWGKVSYTGYWIDLGGVERVN